MKTEKSPVRFARMRARACLVLLVAAVAANAMPPPGGGKPGGGKPGEPPAWKMHGATGHAGFVPPRRLPPGAFRPPAVRPPDHRPCGRIYPHGCHVGPRHILILPPDVMVDSYYWTEEVSINGVYYILYCYPDGTKRFFDGTIFCYF